MARLGQLAADGWRVPDGYAVTAGALAGWLPAAGAGGTRPAVHRRPAPRARRADPALLPTRGAALIESQPLPPWLEDAIADAHARLASAHAGTGPGCGSRSGRRP